jgi:hypothetical protein
VIDAATATLFVDTLTASAPNSSQAKHLVGRRVESGSGDAECGS